MQISRRNALLGASAAVAVAGVHALRRKFATELKATPLKDLCILGGWRSPQTILACYQQPDTTTQRRALEARRPITTATFGS